MPCKQPVAIPDELHVQVEKLLIDIEGLGKRVLGLAALDKAEHLVTRGHIASFPTISDPADW